jgi:proliferating cell nuclear antigen
MKIKLEDPTIFAKSIDLISELVMEVRIKINEFGLSVVAIDPANVAMVSLKVPKSAFSEFEVGEEILGLNLENLKKVLKRCGKTGSLILERNENTLEIKIDDKIKRAFKLNLIEIEAEDKEFPTHLEFSSKVEIDSQDLIDSIDDCSIVSDACSFIVENDKFIIEAKDMNSARSEFSSDLVKIEAENCHSRYSLEYLQKFLKAGKQFPKTLLNFANDHPLRIDFKSEHSSISFLLAPRIETED